MAINSYVERYRVIRYDFFWWRYRLGFWQKLALALGMAVLTGLAAQIRIPLWFTPVPITGQVFAVLLAAVLLGRWYGGLSQAIYTALGGAGVPWFAGWSSGLGVLTGVTGGYIVGFVIAAFVIGWLLERYVGVRRFLPLLGLMLIAVGIIYLFGALQLSLVLNTGLTRTLQLGVFPFIPVDIVKAAAVAAIAHSLLPKAAYNGEVDGPRYPWRR